MGHLTHIFALRVSKPDSGPNTMKEILQPREGAKSFLVQSKKILVFFVIALFLIWICHRMGNCYLLSG
jgi:Na+/H+-translocating membrane pyrophosphatase